MEPISPISGHVPYENAFRMAEAELARSPLRRVVSSLGRKAFVVFANQLNERRGWTVELPVNLFWDAGMNVVLPESMSQVLYRYGILEPGLTYFLLFYLKPGMTFFDVGAHFGYFSVLASDLVGKTGHVHAFEPTPSTFAVLHQNLSVKGNATPHPVAVWSEDSTLMLTDLGTRFSAHNSAFAPRLRQGRSTDRLMTKKRVYQACATSLDLNIAATGAVPDFVKIDAESAESHVLAGMEETFTLHRPIVTLEVGDFGVSDTPSSRALLEMVLRRGYVAFEYSSGAIRRHLLTTDYKYDNILLVPEEHSACGGAALYSSS